MKKLHMSLYALMVGCALAFGIVTSSWAQEEPWGGGTDSGVRTASDGSINWSESVNDPLVTGHTPDLNKLQKLAGDTSTPSGIGSMAQLKGEGNAKTNATQTIMKGNGNAATNATQTIMKGNGNAETNATQSVMYGLGNAETHSTQTLMFGLGNRRTHTVQRIMYGRGMVPQGSGRGRDSIWDVIGEVAGMVIGTVNAAMDTVNAFNSIFGN